MRGFGSRVIVSVRSAAERFRSSLFFFPALFILGAVALAAGMLWLDTWLDDGRIPGWLRTTVTSAQTVLSTVTAATITVAGIAFSLTLVSVQLASSQLSPRVLRHFLRDRFQQAIMGLTVGTFTYGLIVLRATRAPLGDHGDPVTPHVSVAVGLVLGVATIVGILAFIDHGARSLQAGRLVGHITSETREVHARIVEATRAVTRASDVAPEGEGFVVAARSSGWVQQIGVGALLSALPAGGTIRIETRVGAYVPAGFAVATVWPIPEDPELTANRVRDAIYRGRARTMQEDVEFGIRQAVDVGLRALSPGINDPSTAEEVILHLVGVMTAVLCHDLPPSAVAGDDGRRVLRPHELDHEALVNRAFAQLRVAGASQPHVCLALVEALARIHEHVQACAPERMRLLEDQARAVVESCAAADPPPIRDDLALVEAAATFAR